MSKSYEQAARVFWSLPQKPAEERNRDRLFRDDQILHDHLEREIALHLPEVGVRPWLLQSCRFRDEALKGKGPHRPLCGDD
ncbi:hypothetical protein [Paenibacillus cymbidii]|uniref:hypothetical protein n=1 Tax=Paenibacillus cymbidii TaxID=1639034 RepID=UPI0010804619|nr:hypothetical protein [Paenibacillus cymbidii]